MLIYFSFLLFHSFSQHPMHLKPNIFPNTTISSNLPQTFLLDEIGFYSLFVQNEDEINIIFASNNNKRLFLFFNDTDVKIKITIDGIPISAPLKIDGLVIDAFNYTGCKFFLFSNRNNYSKGSYSKIWINLWLLPLDLCPKSSFYGLSNKDLITQISSPLLNPICVFSPNFQLLDTIFDVQFGINGMNESKSYYSFLYNNDINKPVETVKSYNRSKHYFTNASFFIKYNIQEKINFSSVSYLSRSHTNIYFKRSANNHNKENPNFSCRISSIHSCTSNGCLAEKIEDINYKCYSMTLTSFWTTSTSVGFIIGCIVLNVICLTIYCCYRNRNICNNDDERLLNNNAQPLITPNYTQDGLLYDTVTDEYVNDDTKQSPNYENPEGFSIMQQNKNDNEDLAYAPPSSIDNNDVPAYLKPPKK